MRTDKLTIQLGITTNAPDPDAPEGMPANTSWNATLWLDHEHGASGTALSKAQAIKYALQGLEAELLSRLCEVVLLSRERSGYGCQHEGCERAAYPYGIEGIDGYVETCDRHAKEVAHEVLLNKSP